MEYVLTSLEAKEADNYTINELKISSLELMERAGRGIFNELIKLIDKSKKILIICGSGGNGGDGYVIARYLLNADYNVRVLSLGSHFSNETLINKNRYNGEYIDNLTNDYDVYIDAIFGSGLNKNIDGKYFEVIEKVNGFKGLKISVDIPSGLDGTNGKVLGIAFKADYLFTIEFYKRGLFLNEGMNYFNNVKIIKIGLKFNKISNICRVFDINDYINYIPKRQKVSNKGSYGRVALIGGSKEYLGAPILSYSSLASLRLGVGYVTLAIPDSLISLYGLRYPEIMYKRMKDDNDGHIVFNEEDLKSLLNYDVITIGMGIGTSFEVYKIINYLLKNFKNILIIDADGLNSLSKFGVDILKNHLSKVVLTPHLKEFSRLTNTDMDELKENLIDILIKFSKDNNLICNVKSNVSLISNGEEIIFNTNGNPCLAKGGSGDILSGIITGVSNKTNDLLKNIALGSYILGRASELCVRKLNENFVIGSDIINKLNDVLNELSISL